MKSITEASWKDAAQIEASSLIGRLVKLAEGPPAIDQALIRELNSLTRQAVRLADIVDKIDEAKPKRTRKGAASDPAGRV